MFHLETKDNLFLLLIALLMGFVTLAFWFSWKGINSTFVPAETSESETSNDSILIVENTGKYKCHAEDVFFSIPAPEIHASVLVSGGHEGTAITAVDDEGDFYRIMCTSILNLVGYVDEPFSEDRFIELLLPTLRDSLALTEIKDERRVSRDSLEFYAVSANGWHGFIRFIVTSKEAYILSFSAPSGEELSRQKFNDFAASFRY